MSGKKAYRRGNNEGSIYQRKDGSWCGQVLIGYSRIGKPVRKTFYGKTRQEVAAKVSEATCQVFFGAIPVSAKRTTLEQLSKEYLWTFKKPLVADTTFDWCLTLYRAHIAPMFGSSEADKITPGQIQALFNEMHKKGLSQRAIKGVRDLLNQIYRHAVDMRIAADNPVIKTKVPKPSRVKAAQTDTKAITVDDRKRILAAAENDPKMKTALTVLMFTGMRIGEFLALPWGNVDFENSIITIDRAITRVCEYDGNGNLAVRSTVVGDTKTQCSARSFKVTPAVTDVLKQWRRYLSEHMRSAVSHDILAPDAVVFPNDRGEMRSYYGFRATYRRFMHENNLSNYSLHSYRHTFATMLLENGVNPKVVQKLLGHRDIETTLGIYSHVLPEVFDGAANTLTEVYAGMF